jgi:hypothetical protein
MNQMEVLTVSLRNFTVVVGHFSAYGKKVVLRVLAKVPPAMALMRFQDAEVAREDGKGRAHMRTYHANSQFMYGCNPIIMNYNRT